MILKSIELNNYRLYKGINKISFSNENDKNLFLISGENGYGKSTFLHSLLWCLYGRLMADIDESYRKEIQNAGGGYNQMQENSLNEICKKKLKIEIPQNLLNIIKKQGYTVDKEYLKEWSQYAVSLEFSEISIPSIPCRSIKITRSYDIICNEENVEILIDGIKNELSSEIGHEVFINDFILNKDIARFFFFDSEKIVSLAETNTLEEKRKLCSAYNEVLGVKKYEDLKKNLENLRLRFRRKSDDIESRNKLTSLLTKQKSLYDRIAENEKKTTELDDKLLFLRQDNENLQMQLMREGNGMTIEDLKRQEDVVITTKKRDEEYKQRLKTFLEYAPFAISGKLLKQAKSQLEHDFKAHLSQNDIQNQNLLLRNISKDLLIAIEELPIAGKNKKELDNSIKKVVSKYQNQTTVGAPLLNVSKETFDEFLSVYNNITTTYKIEFEHLTEDYRKNKQILNNAVRKVSNMQSNENDNLIKSIRKSKNKIEKTISDIEAQIRLQLEMRGGMNKELAVVSRQITEYSKKVSLDDSDTLKDNVAEELIAKLNRFLVSLKNEKKFSLERRIKGTMNRLMHKSNFISKVEVSIFDDIIEINLFSHDDNIIKKESLSKGEQQLYATSLLKALVEESGIQFPVFIDSPLQKFDKSHANKIITEFYPTVSKQVILFPLLHKELTKNELDTMKPFVNSAFILKNENSYSFIKEVDINDLMKE
jgi:DNA sulfur modification protein DndD